MSSFLKLVRSHDIVRSLLIVAAGFAALAVVLWHLAVLSTLANVARAHPPAAATPAEAETDLKTGLPFSVVVTSWHRSPSDNTRAGGATRSNHLVGCAFDYSPRPHSAENIRALHDRVTELVQGAGAWIEPLSESDTHVHLDFRCEER